MSIGKFRKLWSFYMRISHKTGYYFVAISISFVLAASFSFHLSQLSYASSTSYPSYARIGAHAFYSGSGGSYAFLSGVSGNVSYYVSNVYPNNNSMRVIVDENITLGTEATTNNTMISLNVTDSIFAPTTLLAVPPANLTSNKILFENMTCTFIENGDPTVPAGTFNASEFQGTDSNGTVQDFWFDRASGLVIEMIEPGYATYYQLISSNIAIPVRSQSTLAAEIPFILVFAIGWAGAGVLFYMVRRHYIRKSERENKTTIVNEAASRKKS
jgi:hypothetical protein